MRHFALLFGGLLANTFPLSAQPGSLDPSFGDDGIVTTAFGVWDANGASMALQSDSKIIVAGSVFNGSIYTMGAARYNTNGVLDTTFHEDGRVTTNVGDDESQARACALQPDGKVILGGYGWSGPSTAFAMIRYHSNGDLDSSFGGGGEVMTPLLGIDDGILDMALQPDGRIVAAGYAASGSDYHIAVARYHPDGSFDTGFGTNGWVTTSVGNFFVGLGIALQPDGKILITSGSVSGPVSNIVVLRYLSNGALDPSFGTGGIVTTDIAGSLDISEAVLVQPDGKIIVGGHTDDGIAPSDQFAIAVVRYQADGTPDPSFDGDGIAVTDMGGDAHGNTLALQADGRVIVAGGTFNGSDYDFALVRYEQDGSLDNTFGSTGRVITTISADEDVGQAMMLQADGKILVAGHALIAASNDFAVARYLSGTSIGVQELGSVATALSIFPNPAHDETVLEYELAFVDELSCTLFDAEGRSVRTFLVSDRAAGPHRVGLDLSGLPPGMYTLSLTSRTGARNLQIIKQ